MKNKIWILLGLVLVSMALVAAKYDYLLEMGDKTVKSSECDKCHKIIHEEWSKDPHSMAYTRDAFKKASKNYEMQECVSCHAPQQNGDEKNLKTRPVNKEEGVNCTSCHLRDMMYGPYKLKAAHKSDQDESYLKSESCAGCHVPTFQEWQAGGSKKTCQECHMPRVERKLVQGFPYSLPTIVPKRMVGQHVQGSEQLFEDAAQMTGEAGKGTVKISLTNRAGGHNMPTGKYGDYQMVLKTQVKDADGKTVFTKNEVFSNLKKTGIPPQKTVTFEYPVSTEPGKKYQVSTNLLYQMPGESDFSVAVWNGEMEGGK